MCGCKFFVNFKAWYLLTIFLLKSLVLLNLVLSLKI